MTAIQAISLLEYVAYLLAVFGVSITAASLEGPFGLCKMFRRAVRKRFKNDHDHWLVNGVGCPVCVSFWVALIAAAVSFADRGLSPVYGVTVWLSAVGFTAAVVWLSPPSE